MTGDREWVGIVDAVTKTLVISEPGPLGETGIEVSTLLVASGLIALRLRSDQLLKMLRFVSARVGLRFTVDARLPARRPGVVN